jgi:hypothetical protein
MTNPSPFADSVYAQPGLTHLVRHYDTLPLTGQSPLSAVAVPSPAAVTAENASLADARDEINWRNAQGNIVKTLTPSTTRADMVDHHDDYVNFFDSTSINRNYTG